MGIEFLQQPPQKNGDLRLRPPFEQKSSGYERDGIDLVWAQLGEADASAVFANIVAHFEGVDFFKPVDYGALRLMLHDAAATLDEGVKSSYLAGVDNYIDTLEQLQSTTL